MTETVNVWIDWLLQSLGLSGPAILFVTIPLAVLQSVFSFFPFVVLIVLHVTVFDVLGGMAVSWAVCNIGSVLAYLMFRRYLFGWFDRKWSRRLKRYDQWQHYLNRYGMWTMMLLRTVPVMPNNMINLMSAVSPMKPRSFVWGTTFGNLSYIWLFGTIGSTVIVPKEEWGKYLSAYAVFVVVLLAAFLRRHWAHIREDRRQQDGNTV